MTITELVESVEFVIDSEGNKRAVLLDFAVWQQLLDLLAGLETEQEIPRLTRTAARLMAEKGITLDDLLAGLDDVKEELYEETYDPGAVPDSTPTVS